MSSSGRKEEKRKDGTERRRYEGDMSKLINISTAISRKVIGKSARDNPERYCGWF